MSARRDPPGEPDAGAYCRAIETHLCQRNGHLIRISGPAFDLVRGWLDRGVPLRVVTAGIDRTFERYYAKGPRRRPVHISFCEADVLDTFDAWRRATGVPAAAPDLSAPSEPPAAGHESLPSHLERVIARLTARRAGPSRDPAFDAALDAAIRELDGMRGGARQARGTVRATMLERLAAMDRDLLALARDRVSDDERRALAREAEQQLLRFRERMDAAAYESARTAAVDRLIRDAARLPVVRYDG